VRVAAGLFMQVPKPRAMQPCEPIQHTRSCVNSAETSSRRYSPRADELPLPHSPAEGGSAVSGAHVHVDRAFRRPNF
jgi:hypothetical protein